MSVVAALCLAGRGRDRPATWPTSRTNQNQACAERFCGGVPLGHQYLRYGALKGDGKPKPVAFPDPAVAGEKVGRLSLLPLPGLIELKLASGMSAPHRMKDLADVLELIRATKLPLAMADRLDPSVRDKFRELWQAAQSADAG